jgi:hypothetical protein
VGYVGQTGTIAVTGFLQLQLSVNNLPSRVVVVLQSKLSLNIKLFMCNVKLVKTFSYTGKTQDNFMTTNHLCANVKNHSFLLICRKWVGVRRGPIDVCVVCLEHLQVPSVSTVSDPIIDLKTHTTAAKLAVDLGALAFTGLLAPHAKETEESFPDSVYCNAPIINPLINFLWQLLSLQPFPLIILIRLLIIRPNPTLRKHMSNPIKQLFPSIMVMIRRLNLTQWKYTSHPINHLHLILQNRYLK